MSARELKSLSRLFNESAQAVRRNLTLFIFLNSLTILGTAWNIGLDIRNKTNGNNWTQTFLHSFTGSGNDPKISGWLTVLLLVAGITLYVILEVLAVRAARHQTVRFSEV